MNAKQNAAIAATKYIENGMIVGLGTGTTSYYLVEELGKLVKEGLQITGVTTSNATAKHAESLNIPLKSIDEVPYVDLTIDGADEIDVNFTGTKGGGGALLYEKTVATYSKKYIWIVDESKMVQKLGKFPLPIEVIPYGHKQLMHIFENKNMRPKLRMDEDKLFITDSGHYIIDCHLEEIDNPKELATWLDSLTGVVEHGLFINMVDKVIIGSENNTKLLKNDYK